MTVFLETVSQFKSNLYDVARSVLLSRVRLRGKTTELQEDCEQLRRENQELQRQLRAPRSEKPSRDNYARAIRRRIKNCGNSRFACRRTCRRGIIRTVRG